MITENGKYYLYRYIRIDINKPFYIGIGTKRKTSLNTVKSIYKRAFALDNRNKHFINIIKQNNYILEIVLESDNLEFIKNKEKEFISLYGRLDLNNGTLVNLTDGGDGHYNMSLENRKKLSNLASERFKNKKITNEETLKKMSEWQLGKTLSESTINKRTNTRKENSLNRGYYVPQSKIDKESKKIIQYDLSMNFIKEWESISKASRELKLHKYSIINVCKLRTESTCGFIWRYKV